MVQNQFYTEMMLTNAVVIRFLDDIDPSIDDNDAKVDVKKRENFWQRITSCLNKDEEDSSLKYQSGNVKPQGPIGPTGGSKKRDRALASIVRVMGMQFNSPEWVIIAQGDEGEEMFFIQTGDCIVNIRDHNK